METQKAIMKSGRRAATGAPILLVGSALALLVGCDLTVTNPGPAQDRFLDDPNAHAAVVAGAEQAMARGLNHVAFTGMLASREAVVSGNIHGQIRVGVLLPEESNTVWQQAHRARWVAEDAVRRFRDVLDGGFGSNQHAARALLTSGFANRMLGENMCYAVIDGGPQQPHTVHLENAEATFTEAAEIAGRVGNQELRLAAHAGRAGVRVHKGDWTGAVADAQLVLQQSPNFTYRQRFFAGDWDDYNRFFWWNANLPYRSYSAWSTFFEQYFRDTEDPRVRWGFNPEIPEGDALSVTWYYQLKYPSRESPINLATAREMRLILAEADLRNGDWQSALGRINALRTEIGVSPVSAGSSVETWSMLKRERSIEFWLEGRRMGDLRRWTADGSPGAMEDMSQRSLCIPISEAERDVNPNLG